MPVGNVFSFAWNLLVSMSFQFVGASMSSRDESHSVRRGRSTDFWSDHLDAGFLLTFILHTTHAAKNGSRAGLGITLIQLGVSSAAGHTVHAFPTFADEMPRSSTSSSAATACRLPPATKPA